MAVYVNNISINSGENFYRDFYLDDVNGNSIDLTGYTGKSEVRKHPESVGAATTFSLTFVERPNGRIRLSLSDQQSRKVNPGRYCYDVMFTEGQGPSSNAGVWSTLEANNSGSYRGFTINAWSSFMNTYAYSRVPQSGLLSSQSDPYGVKTDSYVVNFPYTGAYQIEAAADNVGTVTINNTTFNAVNYNDTNVGVGSISLEKGNHTVTLTQQNTQSGTDNFADNPVGIAVSITYIGGTAPGKKSIVIEGNILVSPDITPQCIRTNYTYKFGFIPNDSQTVTSSGNFQSSTVDEISLSQINDYGVVILGYADRCGGMTENISFIQNNITTLEQYLANGGVIWFRGEHGPSCAPTQPQNDALAALGTNIRVRGVSHAPNNTTNISGSTVLPTTLNHSATNGLDGGIALYESSSNGFVTVAYQKIGNGVIFVNADVNADFTSPSDELYDGIRDLVTAAEYTPTVTTTHYDPNP